MNKVIFVGVHNKPGKEPLDSSTISGKRIDHIIKNLNGYECIKTNLFEIERQPLNSDESDDLMLKWYAKYMPDKNTIVVLLGNQVQYSFPKIPVRIVRLAHPSLQYSKVTPVDYISNAVKLIKSV